MVLLIYNEALQLMYSQQLLQIRRINNVLYQQSHAVDCTSTIWHFFFLIFVKTLLTKIIFYVCITHTFLYTTCIVFFSRGRNKQVQILLSSESEISHKQTSITLSLFYFPVLHNVRRMLPNW